MTFVEIDIQAIARAVNHGHPLTICGKTYIPTADPQPPSLREQVAEAIRDRTISDGTAFDYLGDADAVLAVVADWLAAQPLPPVGGNYRPAYVDQRNHDVRLLRGAS